MLRNKFTTAVLAVAATTLSVGPVLAGFGIPSNGLPSPGILGLVAIGIIGAIAIARSRK